MHEFGIAQGLMDVVLGRAREAGATRIEQVNLAIGVLAGVEEEALQFAFRALGEDTPAAETRLVVEKIPLRCYCRPCDAVFECKPFAYRCPTCGAASAEVRTGKELNLVSMEVS
ncbi:MAG TPA: hydrogenase maturation nickel metallochaperone HypA [Kiritimatiellia bacterium]|mgnify:FL=1|nr:hydrogenase maturation nickel metallochaperone HypA [Kiritimatiellia bacterium]HMP34464.1 hydrogenase maturation nickel metallochaperone HypA [Kiritimatiellia bacterium]